MANYRYGQSSADGQWYFSLRASNGKIIMQSEGYRTRCGCLRGIEAVRRAARIAGVKQVPA